MMKEGVGPLARNRVQMETSKQTGRETVALGQRKSKDAEKAYCGAVRRKQYERMVKDWQKGKTCKQRDRKVRRAR